MFYQDPDRIGYYLVDGKKYYEKTTALMVATQQNKGIKWVFNDNVYSKINWKQPIEESLSSIYRRRAQQLRDQYDYLVLYFSGGADSMNVLHAFIDNNIFLDEIVMQLPEPARPRFNGTDQSQGNIYSEVEFSAVPHLNKYQHLLNPNTKIRYQDLSKATIEALQKDDWAETNPLHTNFTIAGVAKLVTHLKETHVMKLCDSGVSVASIVGVDKPLVSADSQGYYAYFLDVSATHATPVSRSYAEIFKNHYHTEFFYWTPRMPEIVVKQAQEIKKYYESLPFNRGLELAQQAQRNHIDLSKQIIHPIIYPKHVEVTFSTEKPNLNLIRPMDNWFWKTANQTAINNYFNVVKYLKQNISSNHFIGNSVYNGLQGQTTQYYYL